MDETMSIIMGGFFIFFFFAFMTILIISYIAQGILYMKLSKKANLKNSWLAWVPFGPQYLNTLLAEINPMMMLIPIGLMSITVATESLVLISLLVFGSISYYIYYTRRIFERFGKNPDLAFFCLIPFFGEIFVYVYYFVVAFGESEYTSSTIPKENNFEFVPKNDEENGKYI